ncbi:unnamed protein product [Bemisia tabaci]|uniref:Dysbindin n=1 Tax=Bemisia tabaci TaxID=7038 RepID=A0A9P0APZ6_BEMTA|nr:unnamed protein product [Bemisia tabaci]
MFTNLKSKLQSVQESVTSSLQSITINSTKAQYVAPEKPNFDAGAELLHKYQTEWNELHNNAKDNAFQAEIVARSIAKMCLTVKKQHNDLERLNTCLATLPVLIEDIHTMHQTLENLNRLVEDVENDLIKLDDAKNALSMHGKMLNEKIELANYEGKKLAELETLRVKLAQDYSLKLTHYEQTQSSKLKERQEVCQEAFQKDIQEYKQSGTLPAPSPGSKSELSLEEIELDSPNDGLDEMLADSPTTET